MSFQGREGTLTLEIQAEEGDALVEARRSQQ